jgi:hypothetical protein
MYLEAQDLEFTAFLSDNKAFWREHTGYPQGADAYIYVDLAHDNPAYLLTNLWIAKYLQRLKPAKVIGLASAWPKACPHYSFDTIKRLGDSFLLDDVIDLDCFGSDDDLVTAFVDRVDGAVGEELRRLVLTFGSDFDPDLGWIFYDTWLRQELRGTFETSNADLVECARRVFKIRRATMQVMRGASVLGAVVGHQQYSPYAWIAREAVRQNAPALFQSLLLPVSIRRFATENDFRRGRPTDFLSVYDRLVSQAVSQETLSSFERRMFNIQRGVRQFFRAIPDDDKVQSPHAALREMGLDAKQPTVCLFVPTLSGPAHCFGPLPFDDNGDWLKKSLSIAAETPSVNFLVKGHPMDADYDVTKLVTQCEAAYSRHPNIRFLASDRSLNQVSAICDVAVTVSGTPGYELAARGVATIAAGPSRYSDLGFSIQPLTFKDYKALLQNPRNVQMTADAQQKAILFLFFEMTAGRSQTSFIPAVRLNGTPSFWTEAVRTLRSRLPEEDPLFRNLRYMIAHDLPFLLNTDVVPAEAAQPMSPRSPVGQLLSGLHSASLTAVRLLEDRLATTEKELAKIDAEKQTAWSLVASWIDEGSRVHVGRGHVGSAFLKSGWSTPEDGGIWTDGTTATMALPSRRAQADLCIECVAYTPENSPSRTVSAWQYGLKVAEREFRQDGSPIFRFPVKSDDGQIEVIFRIDQPIVPPGGTRHLVLWVSKFWLEHPEG